MKNQNILLPVRIFILRLKIAVPENEFEKKVKALSFVVFKRLKFFPTVAARTGRSNPIFRCGEMLQE